MPFTYYSIMTQNDPNSYSRCGYVFFQRKIKSLDSKIGFFSFPNAPNGLSSLLWCIICIGDVRVGDNLAFGDCI